MTQWTAQSLQDLCRSYQLPFVVLVLVRAGVLDRLLEGPASPHDLASSLGVDGAALARLLNALAAVGIVEKKGATFSLPPDLAAGLGGGIGSRLDGIKHAADGLDKWLALEQVLRAGRAEFTDELDVTLEPGRNERFIRAMQAHAGPMAKRLAELVPRQDAETFLDLGGGPGTFCHALLEAWPGLRATVADLPPTLRITRALVEEKGLSDRMSTIEADFYRDRSCDLGGPYDLVLVSAVIHAEGEEENRDLFARARTVVSPAGRIVVRERILGEDRTGPPRAAMFDVHMLVSTRRGRCYTLSEISSMLEEAGFGNPRLLSDLDDGFVIADA
jgi:hypothetical protein